VDLLGIYRRFLTGFFLCREKLRSSDVFDGFLVRFLTDFFQIFHDGPEHRPARAQCQLRIENG
jgi:hypothetical protein